MARAHEISLCIHNKGQERFSTSTIPNYTELSLYPHQKKATLMAHAGINMLKKGETQPSLLLYSVQRAE